MEHVVHHSSPSVNPLPRFESKESRESGIFCAIKTRQHSDGFGLAPYKDEAENNNSNNGTYRHSKELSPEFLAESRFRERHLHQEKHDVHRGRLPLNVVCLQNGDKAREQRNHIKDARYP